MNTGTTRAVMTNTGTARPFLDSIALTELDRGDGFARFSAQPQYVPWPKAYGGDTVAQALAAAAATVGDDRQVHSFHSYFLRPVDIGEPVLHEVRITRDGRGFSTRSVVGTQAGKEVFTATVSFAVPAGRDIYHEALTRSVRHAAELPSAEEYFRNRDALKGPAAEYWAWGRSFDIRHDPGPVYLDASSGKEGHQALWIRAFTDIPRDPLTQQLALAYVCDYTILEPLLRVHGLGWQSDGVTTASLDHSMWFHRPADLNEWVLYVQDAVSAQDGRGLACGRFYTEDGVLVASVAQEGVIRAPEA
ncbi:acyl-CoA thioesterase [Streptomyces fulvoviolaceus]|uniref:acyl-CoA thioesterase n=1 Tax=Streptomyces fulvoviolaceus TaxID=285535 RepID=UPI0005B80278|nr:acyl-CoA thioesterase domain-containing protein [Streptomyces fulvoviolaceus]